jgi:hypothetical protein
MMKVSLIVLVAGCAVVGSAFALTDTPPANPPHAVVMDTPPANPPHAVVMDTPPANPPHQI